MFRERVFLKISHNSQENTCARVSFETYKAYSNIAPDIMNEIMNEWMIIEKKEISYNLRNNNHLHKEILTLHTMDQKQYHV